VVFRSSRRTSSVANAAPSKPHAVKDGERTPGKAAIFSTCYVNYNEPGIGKRPPEDLDHNEVPYVLVEKEACCGMPNARAGRPGVGGKAEGEEHSAPRETRARGATRSSRAVPSCDAHVKQELPHHVSRRGRTCRWCATRCSIRSSTSMARSATGC
jgi:Fe-S oxidoreductase